MIQIQGHRTTSQLGLLLDIVWAKIVLYLLILDKVCASKAGAGAPHRHATRRDGEIA